MSINSLSIKDEAQGLLTKFALELFIFFVTTYSSNAHLLYLRLLTHFYWLANLNNLHYNRSIIRHYPLLPLAFVFWNWSTCTFNQSVFYKCFQYVFKLRSFLPRRTMLLVTEQLNDSINPLKKAVNVIKTPNGLIPCHWCSLDFGQHWKRIYSAPLLNSSMESHFVYLPNLSMHLL